jgi:hypothetical protein
METDIHKTIAGKLFLEAFSWKMEVFDTTKECSGSVTFGSGTSDSFFID